MAAQAPLLTRKIAAQVKIETTKGTAETTGFTDIYVYDIEMNPDAEFQKRNGVGLYLGNSIPGFVEGGLGKCTFGMEVMGYTSHALNPGMAILWQACGLAQATQVYTIHSTFANQKTVTIKYYQDGLCKTLYGAMGNVTFEGTGGKRIFCTFEFSGLYVSVEETALPAFAPATQKPMMFQSGSFTIGAAAKYISRFTLNLQNVVSMRHNPAKWGGVECAIITDYDPEIGVDPEAESDLDGVPTSAFEALWRAGTESAVSFYGSDGTDKVTFTLPKVQYKDIPTGDREGILIYDLKGQCNHSSGNDSVSIAVATL
jgi:hypothetical protein